MCFKCKKGYILNEANNCDLVLKDDVCLSQGTLKKNTGSAYSYLKDDPFKLGCIKCKNTMHSVSFDFAPEICVSLDTTIDESKIFTINFC